MGGLDKAPKWTETQVQRAIAWRYLACRLFGWRWRYDWSIYLFHFMANSAAERKPLQHFSLRETSSLPCSSQSGSSNNQKRHVRRTMGVVVSCVILLCYNTGPIPEIQCGAASITQLQRQITSKFGPFVEFLSWRYVGKSAFSAAQTHCVELNGIPTDPNLDQTSIFFAIRSSY